MKVLSRLIFITFFLAACAAPQTKSKKVDSVAAQIEELKQRQLVVQEWTDSDRRLYRVGYPILVKASSFCKEASFQVGMNVWTSKVMGAKWEEAYKTVYGISGLVEVDYIIPNGPAADGGLKNGDIFISINDWSVPVGRKAVNKFRKKLASLSKSNDPILFKVRRDEKDLILNVTPEKACDYKIVLNTSDVLNAFADGKTITFHKGLMDFFRTDQELALVFSHELAHNTMGHNQASKQNMALGAAGGFVLDLLGALGGVNTQGQFTEMGMRAGASAYSVDFETEADYVGLYIMALSDVEIEKSSHFWRRMSMKNTQSIGLATSHPSNPVRFVGIENTIKEIKEKIAAGKPLRPEMKE